MLNGKSILITGGAGSLGKALPRAVLTGYTQVRRFIIFFRDEQKQFQMAQEYPSDRYPNIWFFIGDVCDLEKQ